DNQRRRGRENLRVRFGRPSPRSLNGAAAAGRIRMRLYETHLPVADTKAAEKFYREIVGLRFAYRDPTRDIVFLWADSKEKAMIGLWGPGTTYGRPIRQMSYRFRCQP